MIRDFLRGVLAHVHNFLFGIVCIRFECSKKILHAKISYRTDKLSFENLFNMKRLYLVLRYYLPQQISLKSNYIKYSC